MITDWLPTQDQSDTLASTFSLASAAKPSSDYCTKGRDK